MKTPLGRSWSEATVVAFLATAGGPMPWSSHGCPANAWALPLRPADYAKYGIWGAGEGLDPASGTRCPNDIELFASSPSGPQKVGRVLAGTRFQVRGTQGQHTGVKLPDPDWLVVYGKEPVRTAVLGECKELPQ